MVKEHKQFNMQHTAPLVDSAAIDHDIVALCLHGFAFDRIATCIELYERRKSEK